MRKDNIYKMAKTSNVITDAMLKEGVSPKNSKEVPWRKLTLDTLNKVRFGRESVIVTNYGKQLVAILPLPDDEA